MFSTQPQARQPQNINTTGAPKMTQPTGISNAFKGGMSWGATRPPSTGPTGPNAPTPGGGQHGSGRPPIQQPPPPQQPAWWGDDSGISQNQFGAALNWLQQSQSGGGGGMTMGPESLAARNAQQMWGGMTMDQQQTMAQQYGMDFNTMNGLLGGMQVPQGGTIRPHNRPLAYARGRGLVVVNQPPAGGNSAMPQQNYQTPGQQWQNQVQASGFSAPQQTQAYNPLTNQGGGMQQNPFQVPQGTGFTPNGTMNNTQPQTNSPMGGAYMQQKHPGGETIGYNRQGDAMVPNGYGMNAQQQQTMQQHDANRQQYQANNQQYQADAQARQQQNAQNAQASQQKNQGYWDDWYRANPGQQPPGYGGQQGMQQGYPQQGGGYPQQGSTSNPTQNYYQQNPADWQRSLYNTTAAQGVQGWNDLAMGQYQNGFSLGGNAPQWGMGASQAQSRAGAMSDAELSGLNAQYLTAQNQLGYGQDQAAAGLGWGGMANNAIQNSLQQQQSQYQNLLQMLSGMY